MLPPPFHLVQKQRIDSSNDEARRLAAAGHGHGTVVLAVEQTAGRGRRGRAWMSPPGNLHCSLLLDQGGDAALSPQLTFVAAVALRQALADLALSVDFRVKWPNDILVDRRKIAGMLLEQTGKLVILGVGVNIVAHPSDSASPAISLHALGSGASAQDLLAGFCTHLGARYDQWRLAGFPPIRAAWLDHAIGPGEAVTARLADDTVLTGRFAGLAIDGALELQDSMGAIRRVLAGDVFFERTVTRDAPGN